MGLGDVGRTLRHRWRLLVAVTLLGALGAGVLATLQTPRYRASLQFYVAAKDQSSDASNAYQGLLSVQGRVASYVKLIRGQSVLQPVVDQLHLPYTWQHLAGEISASSTTGTSLITVSVLDPTPARAQAVANAIGQKFPPFVSQLETLDASGSPVKVSVAQAADLPGSKAYPKTVLDVLLGLILGLVLGLAGAFVLEALDTSIKTVSDVRDRLSLPVLGSIPYDKTTAEHPLYIAAKDGAGRAEAFRQLRTNLQFIHLDDQPRSLLLTSAVAGEGKSTTAANLAITLAQLGVNVVLVDGDLRRSRVSEYLGLERNVGLTSVLVGWVRLRDALQTWSDESGTRLRVLPAGPTPPNPSELLASEQMRRVVASLVEVSDIVIVDGPPLLPVADSAILSTATDGTLLVVRRGKTRREQVAKALDSLRAVDAAVFGGILNMTPRERGGDYYYSHIVAPPAAPPGGEPPSRPAGRHGIITAPPARTAPSRAPADIGGSDRPPDTYAEPDHGSRIPVSVTRRGATTRQA